MKQLTVGKFYKTLFKDSLFLEKKWYEKKKESTELYEYEILFRNSKLVLIIGILSLINIEQYREPFTELTISSEDSVVDGTNDTLIL